MKKFLRVVVRCAYLAVIGVLLGIIVRPLIPVRHGPIDPETQVFVESLLQGRSGVIAVLALEDGRLRAVAAAPAYSNQYTSVVYRPGSLMKLVTAAAALESGAVATGAVFECLGECPVGSDTIKCWRRSGHGRIALEEAMVQKCECYFAQAALECGYARLRETAATLGVTGFTGGAANSDLHTVLTANGRDGILVSPGQMLGLAVRIAREDAKAFKPSTVSFLKKTMREHVASQRGTGKRAQSDHVTVAAFTGCQPRGEGRDAWIIGFVPFEKPRYAFVIMIETTLSCGRTAAPLGKLLAEYLCRKEPEKQTP